MNAPWIGWALAVAAIAVGYAGWGWRGVVLGLTVVVFWMLLQFSRALRAMRGAAAAPVGYVESAVMFNARLRAGLRMIELVKMARSLGEAVSDDPEVWRWHDAGGSAVRVTLLRGRVSQWALERPAGPQPEPPAPAS